MSAKDKAWLAFAGEPRRFKTAVEHWEAGYAAGQRSDYRSIPRGELLSIIWAKIRDRRVTTMQGMVADVLDALDFEMMYRETPQAQHDSDKLNSARYAGGGMSA